MHIQYSFSALSFSVLLKWCTLCCLCCLQLLCCRCLILMWNACDRQMLLTHNWHWYEGIASITVWSNVLLTNYNLFLCVFSFLPLCFSLHSYFVFCHVLAAVGWLSMFQATAPVNIPVVSELAGLGNTNGTGPLTGTGNGISVSWQSPPVIFKGVSVSEALSHAFSSSAQPLLPLLLLYLPVFFYCPQLFI